MSTSLASLETAAKYLSQSDKDQFFKIKREMEASGASRASIEERLHAFIWQIIEADDDDEDESGNEE
jgi:rhamnose utilization protein RhaD (predicted bifunctional aldolase and dehydrogenase)